MNADNLGKVRFQRRPGLGKDLLDAPQGVPRAIMALLPGVIFNFAAQCGEPISAQLVAAGLEGVRRQADSIQLAGRPAVRQGIQQRAGIG